MIHKDNDLHLLYLFGQHETQTIREFQYLTFEED